MHAGSDVFAQRMRRIVADREFSVIGITGGIASGKTVATDALRRAGYTVIDADEVSRELTARGTPCERALVELFPAAKAADGSLDRRALRMQIVSDAAARKKLDEFTHPLIFERISELLKITPPPVILSAPLLFETALSSLCDVVVCIVCPKAVRIKRLSERDGFSLADAEKTVDMQTSDAVRATLADFSLSSNVCKAEFERATLDLFAALCRKG